MIMNSHVVLGRLNKFEKLLLSVSILLEGLLPGLGQGGPWVPHVGPYRGFGNAQDIVTTIHVFTG